MHRRWLCMLLFHLCSVLYRLLNEVAILEDTLMRVMLLGLTDHPLVPQDAQDIVDKMVHRAARAYSTGTPCSGFCAACRFDCMPIGCFHL